MKGGIGSIAIIDNSATLTNQRTFQDVFTSGGDRSWKRNSYSHVLRAMGGFWSSKFTLEVDKLGKENLEDYLLNGLMRDVSSYGPNGDLAFNGYINKVVYKTPGGTITTTLEDMANKVWARYLTANDGLPKQTTPVTDAVSQGLYGIKEEVLSGGVIPTAANATQAAQVYLDQYSNPARPRFRIKQAREAARDRGISLDIFCKGYIQTLFWRRYNQVATTGLQDANDQLQDIVDAVGEFVASTKLEANTIQVGRVYDMDIPALDAIFGVTRMSNASNKRFIIGMYEDRRLVYKQGRDLAADPTLLKYGFRISGNELLVRNLQSSEFVNPALIRPDDWLRVEDVFPTQSPAELDPTKDPQVTYLENLTYSEPFGLSVQGTRAATADNLLARSGFGGSAQI